MGSNAAGLSSKMESFEHIVNLVKPSIFFLQETKMRREGKIKTDKIGNFQIYELIRNSKLGGGLAIGARDELEPALISEGNDVTEILVVEVKLNGMQTRCINGYAPQESDSMEKKGKFWSRLGLEIEEADVNEKAVLFQMLVLKLSLLIQTSTIQMADSLRNFLKSILILL